MALYTLRRGVSLLVTLLVMSLITFVVFHILPGDPAQVMLGMNAPLSALAHLRQQLGLNQPLLTQYVHWLWQAMHGHLGPSLEYGEPTGLVISQRIGVTASLAIFASVISLVIALPFGIVAAVAQEGVWDLVVAFFTQMGLAIPSFWLGTILILVFALNAAVLPPDGVVAWSSSISGAFTHYLMPSVALALPLSASLVRMVRASMLEVLHREYIRTARAKGLAERAVLFRHALKNAFIPVITMIGVHLGALIAGTVVIENVFSLPGLGRLIVSAINHRDLPVVEACVLILAGTVVVVNFLVDLSYRWLDPRVQL